MTTISWSQPIYLLTLISFTFAATGFFSLLGPRKVQKGQSYVAHLSYGNFDSATLLELAFKGTSAKGRDVFVNQSIVMDKKHVSKEIVFNAINDDVYATQLITTISSESYQQSVDIHIESKRPVAYVHVRKQSYRPNEIVRLSLFVSHAWMSPHKKINFAVVDSMGTEQLAKRNAAFVKGNHNFEFTVPAKASSGEWNIRVACDDYEETIRAFTVSKTASEALTLKSSKDNFKPGLPFAIFATGSDKELQLTVDYQKQFHDSKLQTIRGQFTNGKAQIPLDIPINIDNVLVTAKGEMLNITKSTSSTGQYLQAELAAETIDSAQLTILVRSTEEVKELQLMAIGQLGEMKHETIRVKNSKKFKLTLDKQLWMMPSVSVYVFYVHASGEIVYDFLNIHFDDRDFGAESNAFILRKEFKKDAAIVRSKSFFVDMRNQQVFSYYFDEHSFKPMDKFTGPLRMEVNVLGDVYGEKLANLPRKRITTEDPEQSFAEFSLNVFKINYLKTINAISDDYIKEKEEENLLVGYEKLLKHKKENGSFRIRTIGGGSIYSTAFVAKLLAQLKQFVTIDRNPIKEMFKYLKSQQSEDGSYALVHDQNGPIANIQLTAFVAIAFLENKDYLADFKSTVDKSLEFIVQQIADNDLTDYELAISAYALQLGKRFSKCALALDKLEAHATKVNDLQLWAGEDLDTASYALMAFVNEERLLTALPIMKWMKVKTLITESKERVHHEVIHLQALARSAKEFYVSNPQMEISIDTNNDKLDIKVDQKNAGRVQFFKSPSLVREVSIMANGTGMALLNINFYHAD